MHLSNFPLPFWAQARLPTVRWEALHRKCVHRLNNSTSTPVVDVENRVTRLWRPVPNAKIEASINDRINGTVHKSKRVRQHQHTFRNFVRIVGEDTNIVHHKVWSPTDNKGEHNCQTHLQRPHLCSGNDANVNTFSQLKGIIWKESLKNDLLELPHYFTAIITRV